MLHVRNIVQMSLDNLVRKNNTLHHYPTNYPPSSAYRLAPIWLQALTSKYSNCISYNFFIFCPISMKFSQNILHTYSFILSIIKHSLLENLTIFWVAFPLKGTDPFWGHDFLPILVIIIIFFEWKSILRYLSNVSQNIRGLGLRVPEVQNPPQMGANIYIYNCMYRIINL